MPRGQPMKPDLPTLLARAAERMKARLLERGPAAPGGMRRRDGVYPLGEAVRRLAEARRTMPMTPPFARAPAEPDIPEGGRFLSGHHSGPSGGRDYRVYLPSPGRGRPVGLVMMLHGCKQNPEDFAAGTEMNRIG